MLRETYRKNIKKIFATEQDADQALKSIENVLNLMLEDIAQGITQKSQNTGAISHIDIPTAIQIVSDGGIPTKREMIELAIDHIKDAEYAEAESVLNNVLENED